MRQRHQFSIPEIDEIQKEKPNSVLVRDLLVEFGLGLEVVVAAGVVALGALLGREEAAGEADQQGEHGHQDGEQGESLAGIVAGCFHGGCKRKTLCFED